MLEVINKISTDLDKNHKIIKKKYKDMDQALFECRKFLPGENDEKLLLILETVLHFGANPNDYDAILRNNFIMDFIIRGFKVDFIIKALKLGIKYNLDVNYQNRKGRNIITCIFDDNCKYKGQVTPIYNLLKGNGFDIFKTDGNYNTIEDLYNELKPNFYCSSDFYILYNIDKNNKKELKINHINNLFKNESIVEKMNYLVSEYIDEDITFKILKDELKNGYNPNTIIIPSMNRNFIDRIINRQHSFNYIFKLTKLAIEYGLNVNHVNDWGETIFHILIKKSEGDTNIVPMYRLLKDNNFDFNIKDKEGNTIYDLVIKSNLIKNKEQFLREYKLYKTDKTINEEDKNYLENISTFKYKSYIYGINYEQMDDNLYYLSNSILLLVGKKGIGKTTLLNFLRSNIEKKYNRLIFSTSFKDIMKNQLSIGSFKNDFLTILKKCVEYNIILSIDDYDDIYQLSELDKEQIEIMIKYYIDNYNLRIIGSINKENYKKINNDILCDYIDYQCLKEPDNNNLESYIDHKLSEELDINDIYYDIIYNVTTRKLIIYLLLYFNNNEHDVSIYKIVDVIINNIYEYTTNNCSIYNNKMVNKDSIIYALKKCNYIKESSKDIVIDELINLTNQELKEKYIKKLTK